MISSTTLWGNGGLAKMKVCTQSACFTGKRLIFHQTVKTLNILPFSTKKLKPEANIKPFPTSSIILNIIQILQP